MSEASKQAKTVAWIAAKPYLTQEDVVIWEWVPFEFAQKLEEENKQLKEQLELAEKRSADLFARNWKALKILNELEEKLTGHCGGYYHCQRNSYDELKDGFEQVRGVLEKGEKK